MGGEPASPGRDRAYVAFAAVLFAVALLDAPGRSLWLGEALAAWTSQDSLLETMSRAVHYQGQSPFFFLTIWPFRHLFPASEFALRLPSVFAHAGVGVVAGWIGCRTLGREAGLASAFMALGLWPLMYGRLEARPYSLAVLAALLATWALVRWIQEGSDRHLWLWALFMVFTVYGHILFSPVVLLHAVFVLAQRERPSLRARAWVPAAAIAVTGAVPTLIQLSVISGKWSLYSFAPQPDAATLLGTMIPGLVRLFLPLALVLALVGMRLPALRWDRDRVPLRTLVPLVAWVALPPLVLFAISHLRGNSIFVHRYYSWQFPGTALLIAAMVHGFRGGRLRLTLYSLVFVTLFAVGLQRHPLAVEDWEGALEFAEAEWRSSATPLLIWTGLAETKDLEWVKDPAHREYHLAPLTYYGFSGDGIPMALEPVGRAPADFLQPAEAALFVDAESVWMAVRLDEALERSERWMREQGFDEEERRQFGSLTLIRYRGEA